MLRRRTAVGIEERLVDSSEQTYGDLAAVPAGYAGSAGLLARSGGPRPCDHLVSLGSGAGGQQNRELVAAPAAEDVDVAKLAVPGRRRFEQHPIAGLVAVRVVERLEVVEVQQRHGQRLTGSQRPRQLASELLIPAAAVGQPCQRVRSRQTGQHAHLLAQRLDRAHKRRPVRVAAGPPNTKPPKSLPPGIGACHRRAVRGPRRPVRPGHLRLLRVGPRTTHTCLTG
jgi:hypothetical protein